MTRVAVVGAASEVVLSSDGRNDAELLAPVVERALRASGISPADIGVVGTASSEFLNGVVGGVMGAFDAFPGWPPRTHSHLESDGAFSLYECWVRLMAGESGAALVCAFSRPRAEDETAVLGLQLDPYVVAPLGARTASIAALQARAMVDSGRFSEADFASVVSARRGGMDVEQLLRQPYVASPLRSLDGSTICSGAAAVVLAIEEVASASARRPAWIAGIHHLIERHSLGARDLSSLPSVRALSDRLHLRELHLDVLEVHAPFSHQELLVVESVGARGVASLNPSGGALPADPLMATGLIRVASAAEAVMRGDARRAVGHATNGPCLQHNLLCLMESD
ncbi:MAG: lipid-transfer protein [Acidimicrobiales bacterium]